MMVKLNSSMARPIKIHHSPVLQRFHCFHGEKLHFSHLRMNLKLRTVKTAFMCIVHSGYKEITCRVTYTHLMLAPLT